MSTSGGLEVWRGGVNTWECDAMGHMNVRFYVARAMEGLVGLAGALGLNGAFRERATATLLVKDHHIRFQREARAGAPLHMVAGVLDVQECEARFLQLLIHSTTGELAASFQTVVTHVTARDERAFPWSESARLALERLRIKAPDGAAPRSLGLAPSAGRACLAEAEALNLVRLGAGAIGSGDCDVFGRMRPEVMVGRVSDGVPGLGAVLRAGAGEGASERPSGIGGAVLEYRIAYLAWPRAGDRYIIRSGLAAVGDKAHHYVHWMLNPETGRAWGSSEAVAISLDLAARRIIPISPADQALLRTRITPGLTF
ncbi:MAG: hot dog superfamily thioesterase [Caulobacteraceae bacterium]|jgi:acyl-CoA thioester hydrolase|nr:hot dog superfamily thioesterase [Caulobacteraceae bacterium]